jgi:ABC-type glutathione transport system ATPase component
VAASYVPVPSAQRTLKVTDLSLRYRVGDRFHDAVQGVSFELKAGSVLGIAGESGSGKSSVGLSLIGLAQRMGAIVDGSARLDGDELTSLDERGWRRTRGSRIAMIFQDPMTTLNPTMRIMDQVEEVFYYHNAGMGRKERQANVIELLERVGIKRPAEVARSYPHELSGGMRQRVVIAAAVALRPELIIADEPTTALDVTVQKQVLDLMLDLCRKDDTMLILISHDLGVVYDRTDNLLVMRNGRVVESGKTARVLKSPAHDYTRNHLDARPAFQFQTGTAP